MHSEILNKLRVLLDSDDALAARREFNSLKSQFKSLPLEALTADAAEGVENGEKVETPTDRELTGEMDGKPETPAEDGATHAGGEPEKVGDTKGESSTAARTRRAGRPYPPSAADAGPGPRHG